MSTSLKAWTLGWARTFRKHSLWFLCMSKENSLSAQTVLASKVKVKTYLKSFNKLLKGRRCTVYVPMLPNTIHHQLVLFINMQSFLQTAVCTVKHRTTAYLGIAPHLTTRTIIDHLLFHLTTYRWPSHTLLRNQSLNTYSPLSTIYFYPWHILRATLNLNNPSHRQLALRGSTHRSMPHTIPQHLTTHHLHRSIKSSK